MDDEGLIIEGPPDYYSWVTLKPEQWSIDHREHYTFEV